MPSRVVVDASILLASVLTEQYSPNAEMMLATWHGQGRELCAPLLFQYEIVSTLRKRMYLNELTMDEAQARADLIFSQQIQYFHDHALLMRGLALAAQFKRPRAYDSQYLALAERLGCEFWTTDERLYNTVRDALPWVRGLHETTP